MHTQIIGGDSIEEGQRKRGKRGQKGKVTNRGMSAKNRDIGVCQVESGRSGKAVR